MFGWEWWHGQTFSSEPPSTRINKQYLVLGNPFQDPELLEFMRRQWQQLLNWKSTTVEGLTWEGAASQCISWHFLRECQILLASVLTNLLKIILYYRSGQIFL